MNVSRVLVALFVVTFLFESCTPPAVSVLIVGWDGVRPRPYFTWSSREYHAVGRFYSADSLNHRLSPDRMRNVEIYFHDSTHVSSLSAMLTSDSITYVDHLGPRSAPLDSVRQLIIYDNFRLSRLLLQAGVTGAVFGAISLITYLQPGSPEPSLPRIAIATGFGVTLGIIIGEANEQREVVLFVRESAE